VTRPRSWDLYPVDARSKKRHDYHSGGHVSERRSSRIRARGSLARPGANVTGTSTLFEELIPKWFEIISATIPNTRTVAVLANPESVGDEYWWAQAQQAAERIRLNVVRAEAHTPADLDREFGSMKKQRVDAFILMVDAYF